MSRTTKKWISTGLAIVTVICLLVFKSTNQYWYLALAAVMLLGSAVLNNFGLCPYCCRPLGRSFLGHKYCPHCGNEL